MSTPNTSVTLGQTIYIAVKPIFKIYLIIGVGFFLAKKNVLTVDTSRNVSTIAMYVLVPCLVFAKIVTNIDNGDIRQIATIVIISHFMMIGEALLVFLTGVLVGCPKSWYGGLLICGLLPNIGDLPVAYLQTLESANIFSNVDKGVSYVFIYVTFQMLFQFNFGGFKLVEMDFKNDLRNSKSKADLEAGKAINDETNNDTEKSSEQNESHTEVEIPDLEGGNEDEDEIESISTSMESHINPINQAHTLNKILTRSSQAIQSPITRISSIISKSNSISRSVYDNRLRSKPAENMTDIIRTYSRYEEFSKEEHAQISHTISKGKSQTSGTATAIATFLKSITAKKLGNWMRSFGKTLLSSSLHPVSISLVISITVSMIPWVKALFVTTDQAYLHAAPDGLPPLSFVMDFASYIGAAQVPFGLILLGGTIGRLQVKKLPDGLWRTPVSVTIVRLFVFPVIGCALNSKIFKDGLFYGEDILYFVSNVSMCLPPATSILYITAMYTPADLETSLQVDCLALVYICHYIFLVFCLPCTTSYTLKVSLGY